jgi:hypothetical protein
MHLFTFRRPHVSSSNFSAPRHDYPLERVEYRSRAEHKVSRQEVDHVLKNLEQPYPRPLGEGKYVVWGQTKPGRYLQVIFVYLSEDRIDWDALDPVDKLLYIEGNIEVIFVIHARELNDQEKRQLRRSRPNRK